MQHRAGKLKQANKSHKQPAASKRALDRRNRGKVNRLDPKGQSRAASALKGKQLRANRTKQLREKKIQQLAADRRLMAGGTKGPPLVVCFIGLSDTAKPSVARDVLVGGAAHAVTSDCWRTIGAPVTVSFAAPKTRATVYACESRDLTTALLFAKAADVVAVTIDVTGGPDKVIDDAGSTFLTAMKAQGMPAVTGCVLGLDALPVKASADMKKYAMRMFHTEFGGDMKIAYDMKSPLHILRNVTTTRPRPVAWRAARPSLVAQSTAFLPDETGVTGTLVVSGHVRGRPLHAKQLVHIPRVGTFQIDSVRACADPLPNSKESFTPAAVVAAGGAGAAEEFMCGSHAVQVYKSVSPVHAPVIAAVPVEAREPLTVVNDVSYVFSDDEEDVESDGGADGVMQEALGAVDRRDDGYEVGMDVSGGKESESDSEGDVELDGWNPPSLTARKLPIGGKEEEGDDDSDDEAGADVAARRRMELRREAEQEDREFPDEMDTPDHIPAKDRFARFRGLKSFRTTPWNPKEALPSSYARIVQFKSFLHTQKRAIAEAAAVEREAVASAGGGGGTLLEPGWVVHGTCVSLHIANVPLTAMQGRDPSTPLVVGSLLRHENRTSVTHFNITRHPEYDEPLKSKEVLEFHVGFRTFDARPVFSEHTVGCDRHKMLRFVQQGTWCVASVLGPVCYAPCPVLVFKRVPPASPTALPPPPILVASGTVLGVDPDRLVLKKVVLSGYPVRVKNKTATVKFMFHTPEDIRWFKSIELWTKYGHTGHIKDPVGTHGRMKCEFSGNIKQHDTVCLSLWKRVYPKWGPSYRPLVGRDRDDELGIA